MPNPKSNKFVESILQLENFDHRDELNKLAERYGGSIGFLNAVIDGKLLNKDEACKYWADSMMVAYVDPFASVITDEAISLIPIEIAKKSKSVGLYVLDGVLTVAMADPLNADLVKRLGQIAEIPISPVFALPREIEDATAIHYCTEQSLEESISELEHSALFDKPDLAGDKLAALAEDSSLTEILDEIIYFALRERATDLHIEAQEMNCRIRFRIDGNLRDILTYSRKLHRALVSRIKILCALNIAETRFPQDGRFSMEIGSQVANFRV